MGILSRVEDQNATCSGFINFFFSFFLFFNKTRNVFPVLQYLTQAPSGKNACLKRGGPSPSPTCYGHHLIGCQVVCHPAKQKINMTTEDSSSSEDAGDKISAVQLDGQ